MSPTLAKNDLRSCFSLVESSERTISDSFPLVIIIEETTIAFKTPSTNGGYTNLPKTAGWWPMNEG